MGKRLKQIKKSDIPGFEKRVIDSLIENTTRPYKEEKKEQMRCKVEIFEGTTRPLLVDSFIVNTNSLEDTIYDIVSKYDANVQFSITNLYDEKVVAKRFVYTGGYDKERIDRDHYNKRIETIKRIHKFKEEGISEYIAADKLCHIATREYIERVYKTSEEEMKEELRKEYGNSSLGTNLISETFNNDKNNIKDVESKEQKDLGEEDDKTEE